MDGTKEKVYSSDRRETEVGGIRSFFAYPRS
jgi:hypothetical protein